MTIEPGAASPGSTPPGETGDEGVRDASARLAALPRLPVAEHVAVFEDVHRLLVGSLAQLDAADGAEQAAPAAARPGPAVPGPRPAPGSR